MSAPKVGDTITVSQKLIYLLADLEIWHVRYEHTADPDDFDSAGSAEAASLSLVASQLITELTGKVVPL